MERSLRVVTINTGKGDGPFRRRLALLASGLQRLDPDVVLLQESLSVCDDPRDTLNELAAKLDMQASYAPARKKYRWVEGEVVLCSSGLGILARHPIVGSEVLSLPADPDDGERIAQLSALEWNANRILLVNIHLSHLRGRDDLRQQQLAALMAHPWFLQNWSCRLIGGDFNTSVEDLPRLFEGLDGWDWRDGYQEAGGQEQRATVPVDGPSEGSRCIDFILSLSPSTTNHPSFRDAAIVLDKPEDGVYPSDHRGVMVTIAIG